MIFSTIFLIQIIVTIIFSILAAIYDVKYNFVPLKLTFALLVFGLISNLILTIITDNVKFILASFISMVVTNFITYMLWKLKMWGGGDVNLFTAIATVIPTGLNISFLNIFPRLSIYPFSFSVVINSILVSFPFLLIFAIYFIQKNDSFKMKYIMGSIFNIEALLNLIHSSFNKIIPITDLKEGDIVNNLYFDDEHIIDLINEVDGNLEVFKNNDGECKYYFKSLSAGGITKEDMYLIKIMSEQGFIRDEISIKVSFPFTPAIFAGLIIAIFFGDIMMLFTKSLVLVV